MSSAVAVTDATGGEGNLFGRDKPHGGSSLMENKLRSRSWRLGRRLRPDHCRANPRCGAAHRL